MKIVSSVLLILLIISLSAFSYFQLNKIISPCEEPITYKIDETDPRFKISSADFLQASKEAASMWNNAYGENLLVYDPNGDLSINLVFDERQTYLFQIGDLESSVEQHEQSLQSETLEFEKRATDFEAKLDDLNRRIRQWNEQGGAPSDVYQSLIDEQESLKKEADELNNLARTHNQSVAEYNVDIGELNEAVSSFNETLETKPEGGLFLGRQNRIEVYVNNGKQDLVRLLAHEMGHAIGIDHVSNTNSIMYPESNDQTELTRQDITALSEVCAGEKVIDVLFERFNLAISRL